MKTIAKNRKIVAEIFEQATSCEMMSLENSFRGKECSPELAKKELFLFDFAKLRYYGEGQFVVQVHSNLWFGLQSPAMNK